MWEQVQELGCLAAVGDEEQCVVLELGVSLLYHSPGRLSFLVEVICKEKTLTSRMSPKSPCAASQACIKLAATPMDLHVATSFCPM